MNKLVLWCILLCLPGTSDVTKPYSNYIVIPKLLKGSVAEGKLNLQPKQHLSKGHLSAERLCRTHSKLHLWKLKHNCYTPCAHCHFQLASQCCECDFIPWWRCERFNERDAPLNGTEECTQSLQATSRKNFLYDTNFQEGFTLTVWEARIRSLQSLCSVQLRTELGHGRGWCQNTQV